MLRRERAHRGGKTVIIIDDFATHLPISIIEKTAKKIRLACGCGGTVKDRAIEIQGDQPGKIRAILEAEGFLVAGLSRGEFPHPSQHDGVVGLDRRTASCKQANW